MNKSVVTNLLALFGTLMGYFTQHHLLFTMGLFALSGAITNWLAVHMLFEKVPFLYGSGVIPARFEEFKLGIRELMMKQFFTVENIDRFLASQSDKSKGIDFTPIIEKIDLSSAFKALVEVIEQSSFGGMLAMVGGSAALTPLKEPFVLKMKSTVVEITQSEQFNTLMRDELEQPSVIQSMQEKVGNIIDKRLDELTPELVKEIIQTMIRKHLGWLVVWGGVFGGLIGFVAALIN